MTPLVTARRRGRRTQGHHPPPGRTLGRLSSESEAPRTSSISRLPGGGLGGGGWHDAGLCRFLQMAAPIGLSPLPAALSFTPLSPQVAAPVDLSPPRVLPLPLPRLPSPPPTPFLSLGRLCQRSPRTVPVSLLCVGSIQWRWGVALLFANRRPKSVGAAGAGNVFFWGGGDVGRLSVSATLCAFRVFRCGTHMCSYVWNTGCADSHTRSHGSTGTNQ